MKSRIEEVLTVIITTFNRSQLLDETLVSLMDSPIKDCKIVVLNNHSTDKTLEVCDKYKELFPHFQVVTHPVNLGGGSENFLHSIEYCDTEYIWHLADDDRYDFSHFDDVKEALCSHNYDLIQVGAHDEGVWDWGYSATPREFVKRGYDYFRFSSFLPCTIFKFSFFTKYMKETYAALHLRYPHMASLIGAYNEDASLYLSKHRIITAAIGAQRYSNEVPFKGFILLSDLLQNRDDKVICVNAQMPGSISRIFLRLLYHNSFKDCIQYETPWLYYYKLYKIGNIRDKIVIVLFYLPVLFLRLFKSNH